MGVAFLFDRRDEYFDAQDIPADHRFALMRHTVGEDHPEPAPRKRVRLSLWNFTRRIDRKRQKRNHRS